MSQNANYSLLNQKEVDALVDFLNDKKENVKSDTLSQSSIDKLIRLITDDSNHIITDMFDPFANADTTVLPDVDFRKDDSEICELMCSVNSDGHIELTARNTVTGKDIAITPNMIDKSDVDAWGCAIPPIFFNHIAKLFSFKYTTQTHDTICNIFAKQNYGDENHKIPEFYLPSNEKLLECLL